MLCYTEINVIHVFTIILSESSEDSSKEIMLIKENNLC